MSPLRRAKVRFRQLFVLLVVAGTCWSGHVLARQPASLPLDLRYDLYFGGLTVAEFALRYAPNGKAWRSDLEARTVGLVDSFVGFRGEATSEGLKPGDGTVLPASYRYETRSKRVSRLESVRFDPASETAIEVETKKRGIPNQTDVPKSLWAGVIDPLTALIRGRQQLAGTEPRVGSQLVLPVFDGRRRYDMVVDVVGREQAQVGAFEGPALKLDLEVRPLAGFDRDDEDRSRYSGLEVRVLMSDDDRLVPLRISSRNTPITVALVLTDDCSSDVVACR